MRAFNCDRCGSLVFFENYLCIKCESRLAFAPDLLDLVTLDPAGEKHWRAVGRTGLDAMYRRCVNDVEHAVCNWLIPAADKHDLCVSCRHNEVIPDLTVEGNLRHWAKIEIAKRRTLYNLVALNLFPEKADGLKFQFVGGEVLTGHADGVITLHIAEADDAERERRRIDLREPYRTLLGHFRHELGHFYWDKLIKDSPALEKFRELFGDETRNYSDSLKGYYKDGPPADWQKTHVTAYATAHPWEDWAETWAHYLHIIDTLETAASFGMSLKPKHPDAPAMTAEPAKAAAPETPFERILRHWLPLTYALNTLNRGMGLPDLYPFVLSDGIVTKIQFVHDLVSPFKRETASA